MREKFKGYIGICKDVLMKIKAASGITQFQEDIIPGLIIYLTLWNLQLAVSLSNL